jgi:hypothetical protein
VQVKQHPTVMMLLLPQELMMGMMMLHMFEQLHH